MAKQPDFYEPTTTIKPAQTETGKGYEQFSKDFEGFNRQLDTLRQQDVNFDAEQQGRIAGESPDFKYEEPVNHADVVYERSALDANKVALSNNVREQALTVRSEVTKPGSLNANSGEEFRTQMNQYLDGVIQAAPEPNKIYIKNMGQRYIQSIGSTIDTQANAFSKSQLRFQLYDYVDGNMQMAQRYALQGDPSGAFNEVALAGQINDHVRHAVAAGYLPAEQAESMIQSTKQQLQVYSSLGVFRNSLVQGNGEEAMQKFMQAPPSDMGIQQYQQTLSMMNGMISAQNNAIKMNQDMLTQQTIDTFNQIATGQISETDPQVSQVYNNVAAQSPEAGAQFKSHMSKATLQYATQQSLMFVTPAQSDATAEMMMSKLNPNSPNYSTQVAAIQAAQSIAAANYKKFVADPAGVAWQSPMVQQAIEAAKVNGDPFKRGGVTAPFSHGAVDQQVYMNADIVNAVLTQEKMMGAVENPLPGQPQLSILPKSQARNRAAELNGMPLEQQMAYLTLTAQKFGENSTIVFRDLKNGGLPISNNMIFLASQANPASQVNMLNGSRMQDKDIKSIDGSTRSKIMQAVTQQLQPYSDSLNNFALPSTNTIQQVRDTVNKQALYYIFAGKTTDPDTAAKMAYTDYFTNTYNFTNIAGKSQVRMPVDISSVDLGLAAQQTMQKLNADSNYMFYNRVNEATTVENKQAYYDDIISSGKWVTLPDDSGIVLTDKNGNPVRLMSDKNKPVYVEVKFEEMRNPTSDISVNINNLKQKISKSNFQSNIIQG